MVVPSERNAILNSNTVIVCFQQLGCIVVITIFRHGIVDVENIFQHKLNKTMNFIQGYIVGSKHKRRTGIHTKIEDMERHKDAKEPMNNVVAK